MGEEFVSVTRVVVKTEDMALLWDIEVEKSPLLVQEFSFVYGSAPPGFHQVLPAEGPPPPLGSVDRFAVLVYGVSPGYDFSLCFETLGGDVRKSATGGPHARTKPDRREWRPRR